MLILCVLHVVRTFNEASEKQDGGFSQMIDVTSLALEQKNRVLIEALLQNSQKQLGAKSIAICEGGRELISSKADIGNCANNSGFLTRTIERNLSGFSNYRLVMHFPRFTDLEHSSLVFINLFIVGLTLMILRRVQKTFVGEIIGPLKEGIFGNQTLSIQEFEEIRLQHHIAQETQTKVAVADAIMMTNQQIVHDIRSPLTALKVISDSAFSLPETTRGMLQLAVQRIQDIINHLSLNRLPSKTEKDFFLIGNLTDAIISEARLRHRRNDIIINCSSSPSVSTIYVRGNSSEVSRALSNILNNSIEAMDGGGQIKVTLTEDHQSVTLIISDTGKGIPQEILPKLMERGATFGKAEGSGLGLYHAKTTLEKAGGKIQLESRPGDGTTVTLTFKRTETPSWLVSEIASKSNGSIGLAADDSSTRQRRR